MNRYSSPPRRVRLPFPHVRGDEPYGSLPRTGAEPSFPPPMALGELEDCGSWPRGSPNLLGGHALRLGGSEVGCQGSSSSYGTDFLYFFPLAMGLKPQISH